MENNDICDVVYLDRRAREERTWTRDSMPDERRETPGHRSTRSTTSSRGLIAPPDEVERSVRALLSIFNSVTVYQSCYPCINAIEQVCNGPMASKPIMVFVGIPPGEETSSQARGQSRAQARSPSPRSRTPDESSPSNPENPQGMDFLIYLAYRSRMQNLGGNIIPVAVWNGAEDRSAMPSLASTISPSSGSHNDHITVLPFYDAGAVEVLSSPITVDKASSLPSHVYRMNAARLRRQSSPGLWPQAKKTSWVGTKESKPYTQIKEVMVCELMDHIVNPDREELPIDPAVLQLDSARQDAVAKAVGQWGFSAHDFTDDELLYGVLLALEHTLQMPGLEAWRMSRDELITFLLATRRVYNSSVLYHNFRHACDVLQATFQFLVLIGSIPPLHGQRKSSRSQSQPAESPLGTLIDAFHALTLLISAIGHDVGHPGVNNAFLVSVNAPLAQLYNDRSVLESFHCAAYSQILRRYWKRAFEDRTARRLMIQTILATDMGLHADYMAQMEALQTRIPSDPKDAFNWDEPTKQKERELLLCLLIKCADICNVARPYDISAQWARLLIDEFYAQGQIEKDSNIPSTLFGGPPDPSNVLQKAKSQIGFMAVFARPLFAGLARLLPGLSVAVDVMDENRTIWQRTIDAEAAKPAPTHREEKRFDQYIRPDADRTETDAHFHPADNHNAPATIFNEAIFDDARGRSKGTTSTKSAMTHVVEKPQEAPIAQSENQISRKTSGHSRFASFHITATSVSDTRRASGGSLQVLGTSADLPVTELRRSSLGPTVLPPADYQVTIVKRKKKRSSIFNFGSTTSKD